LTCSAPAKYNYPQVEPGDSTQATHRAKRLAVRDGAIGTPRKIIQQYSASTSIQDEACRIGVQRLELHGPVSLRHRHPFHHRKLVCEEPPHHDGNGGGSRRWRSRGSLDIRCGGCICWLPCILRVSSMATCTSESTRRYFTLTNVWNGHTDGVSMA